MRFLALWSVHEVPDRDYVQHRRTDNDSHAIAASNIHFVTLSISYRIASRILRKWRNLKRALKLWRSGLVHRENRENPLNRPQNFSDRVGSSTDRHGQLDRPTNDAIAALGFSHDRMTFCSLDDLPRNSSAISVDANLINRVVEGY